MLDHDGSKPQPFGGIDDLPVASGPTDQVRPSLARAVSASAGLSVGLTQRLIEGTLDLAVMYRPTQPPGLTIEHLFDEEFVLVTSVPPTQRRSFADYVFIDWGPDFQQDHAAAGQAEADELQAVDDNRDGCTRSDSGRHGTAQ